MEVLLDANMLMTPIQHGVDVFSELQRLGFTRCLVPRPVLHEINTLAQKAAGKDKRAARVGASLARRCHIVEIREPADDAILSLAQEREASVATNDVELIRRLKENGVRVVRMRGGTHLTIE